MKEKIGNVILNLDFYEGKDYYSDGDEIEEEILDIAKSGNWEDELYRSQKWPILYHFSEIRGNIIEWFPFDKEANLLEIGSGCGAVSGFLCKKVSRVVGIELSKRRSQINAYRNRECNNLEIIVGNFKEIKISEKFDYITLIGVLEYAGSYIDGENPYEEMLNKIKGLLKPNGKIFIAIENKMGMKYLNGAKEDHVGKRFAGIEDYRYIHNVRTFSKPELCHILERCGIQKYRFYYPSPDYKLPDSIYSDSFLPKCGDIRIWGQNYDTVRIGLYNEAIMADQICKDNKFAYFANSYLVICNEDTDRIEFIHYSCERKKEYQIRTTIEHRGGQRSVQKAYLKTISRNYDIFCSMNLWYKTLNQEFPNVIYLPAKLEQGKLTYDFVDGIPLDLKLAESVHDIDKMLEDFRMFLGYYMKYNEKKLIDFKVTEEYKQFFGEIAVITAEKSLEVTNLDMLLHNMILRDGKVYCFDYEWLCTFPIPFEYVLYRCIMAFYVKFNMYFSELINKKQILLRLGIKEENIPIYQKMEERFSENAYGINNCCKYLKNYRKPKGTVSFEGI